VVALSGDGAEITWVTPSPRLIAQPDWSLSYEEGIVVASGGADALFAIPDLDSEDANALLDAWRSGAIDPAALAPDARGAAFRLRDLGVVRGEPQARVDLRLGLRFVGARLDGLVQAFVREELVEAEGEADLVVFVRTNAVLAEACGGDYASLQAPHLLLDLGFRHTVSLGPLVFPGETACLGCLVGRIAHYWGDARPPEHPAVQRHASLAAALLAHEVERFALGDFRLVNETVALCLDRLETRRESVYRLPWCPVCRQEEERLGSIPLPWTAP